VDAVFTTVVTATGPITPSSVEAKRQADFVVLSLSSMRGKITMKRTQMVIPVSHKASPHREFQQRLVLFSFCWWRDIRRLKVRSVAEALGEDYKAWLATCQQTDLISVMCAVPDTI